MSLSSNSPDLRSKVLAVLSLVDPRIRSLIVINYLSSVQQISDALMAYIAGCQDLDILAFTGLPAEAGNLTASTVRMKSFREFLAQRSKDKLRERSLSRPGTPWSPTLHVNTTPKNS